MEMLWQCIGAFVAVAGFGTVLGVPKKLLLWAGIDGALGWMTYLVVFHSTSSVVFGSFVGAVVISTGAHVCARIFKTPVTLFLIPANMTLVPGAGMYRIVYNILKSENGMANFYLLQTLQVAGVIALAIFIVNVIFSSVAALKKMTGAGRKH